MSKVRVGVLRGGPSSEYEVSLKTGASVLRHLPRDRFEPLDVFIDKAGRWHLGGLPVWPEQAAEAVDVFFNALHGEYGEDGQIQRLLEELGRPYTGPEEMPAIAAMNKVTAKNLLARAGIKTPPGMVVVARISPRLSAEEVFNRLSPPWVVKPVDRGSSIGVSLAKSFNDLIAAIGHAAELAEQILIEQFIAGKEGTVGVVENFRNQSLYPLLPLHILKPATKNLWHYEDKYSGLTQLSCPGGFSEAEKAELARLATLAHGTLGLRHYSRSDFIVSPRGIYLLEVNSLPGLTNACPFPASLEHVGARPGDFLTHIVDLALLPRYV